MKLIIQPEHGVVPILHGIDGAEKSIEIAIFRFDHADIKQALEKAEARNVSVRALIANTNHDEERQLLRYDYKFMIIGRKALHLLAS